MTNSRAVASADLTGATIYVEADGRSVAHGRWHVLANDSVYFERVTGEITKSLIAADTLRSSPTWSEVSAD